jgi:hypothetical protein
MRPSNKSRSRNKSGGNGNRRNIGNIINRVFESAGPEGKVRGTPQQIIEKYNVLARDAQLSGDRVAAENFLQHSEHYSRLLGEAQRQMADQRGPHDRDDAFGREDGQPEQHRHHRPMQSMNPDEGSGLVTVEHDETADPRGPAEHSEQVTDVRPREAQAEPRHKAPAQSEGGTEPPASPDAPPKRSRPRRRPKPEANAAEAPAE